MSTSWPIAATQQVAAEGPQETSHPPSDRFRKISSVGLFVCV
jgi:hypothetical protein